MNRIDAAGPNDIPALIGLMAEFYAESSFPLPEGNARAAFTTLFEDSRLGGAWIAWVDDQPAGHAVLTVSFSMEYGGLRGFVDDLFVRPGARGQGIAGALIEAIVADCGWRGVRSLHVEAGPDNESALRAYARSGFVDSGHLLLTRQLLTPIHMS